MTKTDKLLEFLRAREGKATTIEQMAKAAGAKLQPTRSALCALKATKRITYEPGDYTTIKVLAGASSSTPASTKVARPSRSRIPYAPRRSPKQAAPAPTTPEAPAAPKPSEDGSKDIFGASPSSRAVIVTEEDLVVLRRCVMILDGLFSRMTSAPTLGQHFTTLVSRMVDPNAQAPARPRACRVCGCTEADCRGCIERTGEPCSWVEKDLCSACVVSRPPRKAKRAPAAKAAKEEPKPKPRAARRARPAPAAAKAAKEEDVPAPAPSPAPAPAPKASKPNGVKTRYFGPEGNRNPLPTPGRAPRPKPEVYGEQVDAGELADGEGGDVHVMPDDGARFAVIGFAGDELSRHADLIPATQAMQRNGDGDFVRRLADGKPMTQPKRPAA